MSAVRSLLCSLLAVTPALAQRADAGVDAGVADAGVVDAGAPSPPPVEEPPLDMMAGDELELFALDEELKGRVVEAASKKVQSVATAPAAVEVLSAEDLRLAGYQSVGEALQPVVGLAVFDDLVFHNIGVRGVFGGLRAGSRGIKVLLNGHPIAYRTTSANYLGPELVPIELVERIEIIRGPGSVLYGANAFLAVINVVTRTAPNMVGAITGKAADRKVAATISGAVTGGTASQAQGSETQPDGPAPGYGASFAAAAVSDSVEVVGGGSLWQLDRSGLRLPESSPRFEQRVGAPFSTNDVSKPRSLFARITHRSAAVGMVSLTGSLSSVDTYGEFQDRNTLTHSNHIQLTMGYVRADFERKLTDAVSLRAFGAWQEAGPGDAVRGLSGVPFGLRLKTRSRALDVGVEAAVELPPHLSLLVGGDFSWNEERNPTAELVYLRDSGLIEEGSVLVSRRVEGAVPFRTFGGYALATATPFATGGPTALNDLGVTFGMRYQYNSVYRDSLDWRAGLVKPLFDDWHVKLLAGSSFKGPSAEELFAIPLQEGDPVGNVRLKPQRANTIELVVGYLPSPRFSASLVGYVNFVRDQIRYRDDHVQQTPENVTRQDSGGVELQVRASKSFGNFVFSGFANGSVVGTYAERPGPAANLPPVPVAHELYPTFAGNAALSVRHTGLRLHAYVETRVWSNRPASQDNVTAWRGGRQYELPPVALVDVALGTDDFRPFAGIELRLLFKVTNLFDSAYAMPGFFGYDVPGRQRGFLGKLQIGF